MAKTYYPNFDTLEEQDAWDPYTHDIVLSRLGKPKPPRSLSAAEADTLRAVVTHLLHDRRDELLDFVVAHVDQRMQSAIGEAQRKPNLPPEATLLHQGFEFLGAAAQVMCGQPFIDCPTESQFQIVAALQLGKSKAPPEYYNFPQKALFKKLQGLAVEAYASHPTVWSEMGYAGPAYPRGYYRIERGLHDPWEPGPAATTTSKGRDESGTS